MTVWSAAIEAASTAIESAEWCAICTLEKLRSYSQPIVYFDLRLCLLLCMCAWTSHLYARMLDLCEIYSVIDIQLFFHEKKNILPRNNWIFINFRCKRIVKGSKEKKRNKLTLTFIAYCFMLFTFPQYSSHSHSLSLFT